MAKPTKGNCYNKFILPASGIKVFQAEYRFLNEVWDVNYQTCRIIQRRL
jgi:hypothetical protein